MTRRKSRTTLKDVARAVGVNVSTVSRALNPDSRHGVSEPLAARIRAASRRLKYAPNAAASSLRTSRTRTVGVIVPDITDPAYPPIIRGIEDGLATHGYVAILANTDGDARRQQRIIETLRARSVDGLILATVARADPPVTRLAGELPLVTVVRANDDARIASIVHDEEDGIRRILTHLVSYGHREIAMVAGPQTLSTGFRRLRAFEQQRKALGLARTKPNVAFAMAFNEGEGERCAEELLARGQAFTALVCANDRLAVGAIAALRRHGLRCPEDVSVTGYNDMPLADRLLPPLTTVRVQHHKGGFESAELIVELMREQQNASVRHAHVGHTRVRHVVLPVEIVIRGSTQPLGRQSRKRALAGATSS
jgi:LacI family transcriptional regulator